MIENDEKYNIYITQNCKNKLDWITKKYENEIQVWLGGDIKNDIIIIDELLISEQTAGLTDVEVKSSELIKMRKEYGNKCSRIIGQFHSHNSMGAFWSNIDNKMQKKYLTNSSKDFSVFIVGSEGEYKCRLALKKPFPIIVDEVNLKLFFDNDDELEKFKKDIKKKVTVKKVKFKNNKKNKKWENFYNDKKVSILSNKYPRDLCGGDYYDYEKWYR